ncbi:type III-A CRISPR-associated RAMP protein Csm5 [Dictyoglomus turgidum]|uniref:type III-A CRISPR-associated RAMP protein Csm5 n=1 Tax=Dictyoglomus turgidum TaxID=513050 RepID=UPI002356AAE0|nr:type III-A CRISPR-associated RAMP protein Csm5 [Dictyoglomus turgidum]
MKIKIQVITPTLIRSGEVISNVSECVIEDNRLKIIDKEKLLNMFKDKNLKNFVNELSSMITNQRENIKDLLNKYKIPIDEVTKYSLEIKSKIERNNESSRQPSRNIYMPILTGENAYIPGSTLKGVIRNALLFYALEKDKSKQNAFLEKTAERIKSEIPKKNKPYIGEDILRTNEKDIHTDIMKYIIVRDSSLVPLSELNVYVIRRIPHQKLSQYVIAIPNGKKFDTEIIIKKDMISNIPTEWKDFFEKEPEEKLWSALKNYSLKLSKKEQELLSELSSKKYSNNEEAKNTINDLIEHYNKVQQKLKEQEQKNKEVIYLPIGFGKTYYYNSLGYFIKTEQLKNLGIIRRNVDPQIYPSTRWAVQIGKKLFPLGGVCIIRND